METLEPIVIRIKKKFMKLYLICFLFFMSSHSNAQSICNESILKDDKVVEFTQFFKFLHQQIYKGELKTYKTHLSAIVTFQINDTGKIINYNLIGHNSFSDTLKTYIKSLTFSSEDYWTKSKLNSIQYSSDTVSIEITFVKKFSSIEENMKNNENNLIAMETLYSKDKSNYNYFISLMKFDTNKKNCYSVILKYD